MKVKFSRCNSNSLSTVPVVDGQLIFVKDTMDNYLDVGENRVKLTDIIQLDTEADRTSLAVPVVNKVYLVLATNKFYKYNGTAWEMVGGGSAADTTYDNTTSELTATNVQAAIDELSAKIDELTTAIDNIGNRIDGINGETI